MFYKPPSILQKAKLTQKAEIDKINNQKVARKVDIYTNAVIDDYIINQGTHKGYTPKMVTTNLKAINKPKIDKEYEKVIKSDKTSDTLYHQVKVQKMANEKTIQITEAQYDRLQKNIQAVDKVLRNYEVNIDKYKKISKERPLTESRRGIITESVMNTNYITGLGYNIQPHVFGYKDLTPVTEGMHRLAQYEAQHELAIAENDEALSKGEEPPNQWKTWVWTGLGETTRHFSNNGQTVPINEPFIIVNDNDGQVDEMMYPLDPAVTSSNGWLCYCELEYHNEPPEDTNYLNFENLTANDWKFLDDTVKMFEEQWDKDHVADGEKEKIFNIDNDEIENLRLKVELSDSIPPEHKELATNWIYRYTEEYIYSHDEYKSDFPIVSTYKAILELAKIKKTEGNNQVMIELSEKPNVNTLVNLVKKQIETLELYVDDIPPQNEEMANTSKEALNDYIDEQMKENMEQTIAEGTEKVLQWEQKINELLEKEDLPTKDKVKKLWNEAEKTYAQIIHDDIEFSTAYQKISYITDRIMELKEKPLSEFDSWDLKLLKDTGFFLDKIIDEEISKDNLNNSQTTLLNTITAKLELFDGEIKEKIHVKNEEEKLQATISIYEETLKEVNDKYDELLKLSLEADPDIPYIYSQLIQNIDKAIEWYNAGVNSEINGISDGFAYSTQSYMDLFLKSIQDWGGHTTSLNNINNFFNDFGAKIANGEKIPHYMVSTVKGLSTQAQNSQLLDLKFDDYHLENKLDYPDEIKELTAEQVEFLDKCIKELNDTYKEILPDLDENLQSFGINYDNYQGLKEEIDLFLTLIPNEEKPIATEIVYEYAKKSGITFLPILPTYKILKENLIHLENDTQHQMEQVSSTDVYEIKSLEDFKSMNETQIEEMKKAVEETADDLQSKKGIWGYEYTGNSMYSLQKGVKNESNIPQKHKNVVINFAYEFYQLTNEDVPVVALYHYLKENTKIINPLGKDFSNIDSFNKLKNITPEQRTQLNTAIDSVTLSYIGNKKTHEFVKVSGKTALKEIVMKITEIPFAEKKFAVDLIWEYMEHGNLAEIDVLPAYEVLSENTSLFENYDPYKPLYEEAPIVEDTTYHVEDYAEKALEQLEKEDMDFFDDYADKHLDWYEEELLEAYGVDDVFDTFHVVEGAEDTGQLQEGIKNSEIIPDKHKDLMTEITIKFFEEEGSYVYYPEALYLALKENEDIFSNYDKLMAGETVDINLNEYAVNLVDEIIVNDEWADIEEYMQEKASILEEAGEEPYLYYDNDYVDELKGEIDNSSLIPEEHKDLMAEICQEWVEQGGEVYPDLLYELLKDTTDVFTDFDKLVTGYAKPATSESIPTKLSLEEQFDFVGEQFKELIEELNIKEQESYAEEVIESFYVDSQQWEEIKDYMEAKNLEMQELDEYPYHFSDYGNEEALKEFIEESSEIPEKHKDLMVDLCIEWADSISDVYPEFFYEYLNENTDIFTEFDNMNLSADNAGILAEVYENYKSEDKEWVKNVIESSELIPEDLKDTVEVLTVLINENKGVKISPNIIYEDYVKNTDLLDKLYEKLEEKSPAHSADGGYVPLKLSFEEQWDLIKEQFENLSDEDFKKIESALDNPFVEGHLSEEYNPSDSLDELKKIINESEVIPDDFKELMEILTVEFAVKTPKTVYPEVLYKAFLEHTDLLDNLYGKLEEKNPIIVEDVFTDTVNTDFDIDNSLNTADDLKNADASVIVELFDKQTELFEATDESLTKYHENKYSDSIIEGAIDDIPNIPEEHKQYYKTILEEFGSKWHEDIYVELFYDVLKTKTNVFEVYDEFQMSNEYSNFNRLQENIIEIKNLLDEGIEGNYEEILSYIIDSEEVILEIDNKELNFFELAIYKEIVKELSEASEEYITSYEYLLTEEQDDAVYTFINNLNEFVTSEIKDLEFNAYIELAKKLEKEKSEENVVTAKPPTDNLDTVIEIEELVKKFKEDTKNKECVKNVKCVKNSYMDISIKLGELEFSKMTVEEIEKVIDDLTDLNYSYLKLLDHFINMADVDVSNADDTTFKNYTENYKGTKEKLENLLETKNQEAEAFEKAKNNLGVGVENYLLLVLDDSKLMSEQMSSANQLANLFSNEIIPKIKSGELSEIQIDVIKGHLENYANQDKSYITQSVTGIVDFAMEGFYNAINEASGTEKPKEHEGFKDYADELKNIQNELKELIDELDITDIKDFDNFKPLYDKFQEINKDIIPLTKKLDMDLESGKLMSDVINDGINILTTFKTSGHYESSINSQLNFYHKKQEFSLDLNNGISEVFDNFLKSIEYQIAVENLYDTSMLNADIPKIESFVKDNIIPNIELLNNEEIIHIKESFNEFVDTVNSYDNIDGAGLTSISGEISNLKAKGATGDFSELFEDYTDTFNEYPALLDEIKAMIDNDADGMEGYKISQHLFPLIAKFRVDLITSNNMDSNTIILVKDVITKFKEVRNEIENNYPNLLSNTKESLQDMKNSLNELETKYNIVNEDVPQSTVYYIDELYDLLTETDDHTDINSKLVDLTHYIDTLVKPADELGLLSDNDKIMLHSKLSELLEPLKENPIYYSDESWNKDIVKKIEELETLFKDEVNNLDEATIDAMAEEIGALFEEDVKTETSTSEENITLESSIINAETALSADGDNFAEVCSKLNTYKNKVDSIELANLTIGEKKQLLNTIMDMEILIKQSKYKTHEKSHFYDIIDMPIIKSKLENAINTAMKKEDLKLDNSHYDNLDNNIETIKKSFEEDNPELIKENLNEFADLIKTIDEMDLGFGDKYKLIDKMGEVYKEVASSEFPYETKNELMGVLHENVDKIREKYLEDVKKDPYEFVIDYSKSKLDIVFDLKQKYDELERIYERTDEEYTESLEEACQDFLDELDSIKFEDFDENEKIFFEDLLDRFEDLCYDADDYFDGNFAYYTENAPSIDDLSFVKTYDRPEHKSPTVNKFIMRYDRTLEQKLENADTSVKTRKEIEKIGKELHDIITNEKLCHDDEKMLIGISIKVREIVYRKLREGEIPLITGDEHNIIRVALAKEIPEPRIIQAYQNTLEEGYGGHKEKVYESVSINKAQGKGAINHYLQFEPEAPSKTIMDKFWNFEPWTKEELDSLTPNNIRYIIDQLQRPVVCQDNYRPVGESADTTYMMGVDFTDHYEYPYSDGYSDTIDTWGSGKYEDVNAFFLDPETAIGEHLNYTEFVDEFESYVPEWENQDVDWHGIGFAMVNQLNEIVRNVIPTGLIQYRAGNNWHMSEKAKTGEEVFCWDRFNSTSILEGCGSFAHIDDTTGRVSNRLFTILAPPGSEGGYIDTEAPFEHEAEILHGYHMEYQTIVLDEATNTCLIRVVKTPNSEYPTPNEVNFKEFEERFVDEFTTEGELQEYYEALGYDVW